MTQVLEGLVVLAFFAILCFFLYKVLKLEVGHSSRARRPKPKYQPWGWYVTWGPYEKPKKKEPPKPKSPPDLRIVGGSGGNKIKRT
jgi:hypothetical protein